MFRGTVSVFWGQESGVCVQADAREGTGNPLLCCAPEDCARAVGLSLCCAARSSSSDHCRSVAAP